MLSVGPAGCSHTWTRQVLQSSDVQHEEIIHVHQAVGGKTIWRRYSRVILNMVRLWPEL